MYRREQVLRTFYLILFYLCTAGLKFGFVTVGTILRFTSGSSRLALCQSRRMKERRLIELSVVLDYLYIECIRFFFLWMFGCLGVNFG